MKTIITILLFVAGISANAQRNYKVGDTIRVDNDLTLIVTDAEHACVADVKNPTMKFPYNKEIIDYHIVEINASGFTPPLSDEIAKNMMQIFHEVFTEEELDNFVKNVTEYSSEGIHFFIMADLKGAIAGMSIMFWPKNPIIDAIPKEKIGRLYKLIIDRLKFNIRNTGLEYYNIDLRVKFKDVVNGTLDYSHLMRNINDEGYPNYYWKEGKLYKFE